MNIARNRDLVDERRTRWITEIEEHDHGAPLTAGSGEHAHGILPVIHHVNSAVIDDIERDR